MCLTAKKQSILDLWVGFFFSKKEKWQFPVFDTFNLETDFCPVILAVGHNLGGAKDGDVSVWEKLVCAPTVAAWGTVDFVIQWV